MRDIHYFTGRMGNEMFRHAYLYAQTRDGVIPDWYVQDHAYFEKYENEIKQMFGEGIGSMDYVSIHVRRAANPINPDEPKYSDNPFYVNLPETDYYEQAMDKFPGKRFLVFSDDIEFAKERFSGSRFDFVEGGTELSDFNMMASCQSNIIANSSFSWWAAYLNPNQNKVVVAPSAKNWYADGIERTKCPSEWIRI